MNNFEYENQLGTVQLVYHVQPDEEIDTFVLGMLCNNEIQGVAKTIFTQIDSEKLVKYNVSSKIAVSNFFEGLVNKKRLVGVFSGMIDAMLSVEDYMIDQRALLLNLDYIFTDVSTYDTIMICLPIVKAAGEPDPDINAFFKNIIFNTKFDQTENCDYVAQILNYLNSNPTLVLKDFKKLLEALSKAQRPVKPAQSVVDTSKCVRPTTPETVSKAAVQAGPGLVQPPNDYQNHLLKNNDGSQANIGTMQAEKPVNRLPMEMEGHVETESDQKEKNMSVLYLLRHYSKENMVAYKAQKEKKKEKKTGPVPAPKAKQPTAVPDQGFQIPQKAEPTVTSFVVPGQKPNIPQSAMSQSTASQPVVKQEKTVSAQPAVPRNDAVQGNYNPVKPQPAAPINFGQTTVLSGNQMGETTVLHANADPVRTTPHLIRMRNNEKIPLNKPVFRIGKERSFVDYFIGDNAAISRSHANLINESGEFFIMDTNSTNHTYVNGGMIQSNVKVKLSHGTKIRLANEDFEFRLY